MYLKHFKLQEEPFSTTPDPKFLYKSELHIEALDRLTTSVNMRRGINAIIGEPGLGKSTLIRTMLKGLQKSVQFAWVFNTTLNARDLVKYICLDFGLQPKGSDVSELLIELYTFLIRSHEQGKVSLLIIDEAQNLAPAVLEEIRQLSNLETLSKKLLQVILSGQPALDAHLELPELRQLKQRISLKAVLKRLGLGDTKNYIRHRLQVAGSPREDLFSEAAMDIVHKISDGVPRLINQVCDNALLSAYKRGLVQVDSILVMELLEKRIVMSAGAAPVLASERKEQSANQYQIVTNIAPKQPATKSFDKTQFAAVPDSEFDSLDLLQLAIKSS